MSPLHQSPPPNDDLNELEWEGLEFLLKRGLNFENKLGIEAKETQSEHLLLILIVFST